jgi:hypothetical protein
MLRESVRGGTRPPVGCSMLGWLRRKREFERRVDAEIAELDRRHSEHAYGVAYSCARERVQPEDDRRFNQAVRSKLARRLGIEYGLDTATRYLDKRQ